MLHCSKLGTVRASPPRGAPEERDMKADPRSSAQKARTVVEASAAVCTECPVCGSEECLMLEELGNYCATMTAASLARKREESRERA